MLAETVVLLLSLLAIWVLLKKEAWVIRALRCLSRWSRR